MSAATVTSSSARPGGSRWVPAALLPLVALLAGGCGAPEERDPVEIDCSAVDEYEIQEPMIMDFENVDQAGWWFQFGDGSTGAFPPPENAPEPESAEIEDGGRCGSQRALVLTAYGNNFWGSGYGTWQFRTVPRTDGAGTDGLALWAAYPPADVDLSAAPIAATSIYASEDGLTSLAEIEASRAQLPPDTVFIEIVGGNHAGFGSYGEQDGDGVATIDPEEQQAQVVAATVELLQQVEAAAG